MGVEYACVSRCAETMLWPMKISGFGGLNFVGLAYYQGKKDIVFIRFIIEYT